MLQSHREKGENRMKKIFYRLSIALPLVMLFLVFLEMPTVCITEIGLYLDRRSVELLYITLSVVWLCCSPLKKACCTGDIPELLYNLVPLEAVAIITFSQYHFIIAVALIILMAILHCIIIMAMRWEESKGEFSTKRHRSYTHGIQRAALLISAVVFSAPCFMAFFVYELKSPTYETEESVWEILFGGETEEEAAAEEEVAAREAPDPYEENKELLLYFDDETWENLNIQQRITVAQEFVDFQSELLGIPTSHVTAEKLGTFTLGQYNDASNEIQINIEHLAASVPEDVICTIAHEVFHSYEYYLMNNIDWSVNVFQSAYFQEIWDWKTNSEDYQQPYLNGYDAYADQPLEASARAYSIEETAKIVSYIYLLKAY